MIGTATGLLLALLFLFSPLGHIVTASWSALAIGITIIATLIILLVPLIQIFSWSPLQQAETHLTGRLMELKKRDKILSFSSGWLIFFPLISYALALFGGAIDVPLRTPLLAGWVFLLGISLDVIHSFIKRITSYFNPYAVLDHLANAAKANIQNDREIALCDIFDTLSETAVKSLNASGISLSLQATDKMQEICRHFLEASKSIAHHERSDRISYTLFYLLQRLEMINRLGASKELEPVCSGVVTTLGKVALHSAKCDISLVPFSVQVLGRCALFAQQHHLPEVGLKATITLLEVAKTILQEVNVTYLELKETYTAIVNQLDEIAKEAFKIDKSLSISVLKQPLLQLRELFTSEKMAGHPDTAVILDAIDRATGEFDALEMVLRSIPPIPNLTTPEQEPPAQGAPLSPGA